MFFWKYTFKSAWHAHVDLERSLLYSNIIDTVEIYETVKART